MQRAESLVVDEEKDGGAFEVRGKFGRRMNEQTARTGLTSNYIGNATNKISNSTLLSSIRVQGSFQLSPGT